MSRALYIESNPSLIKESISTHISRLLRGERHRLLYHLRCHFLRFLSERRRQRFHGRLRLQQGHVTLNLLVCPYDFRHFSTRHPPSDAIPRQIGLHMAAPDFAKISACRGNRNHHTTQRDAQGNVPAICLLVGCLVPGKACFCCIGLVTRRDDDILKFFYLVLLRIDLFYDRVFLLFVLHRCITLTPATTLVLEQKWLRDNTTNTTTLTRRL